MKSIIIRSVQVEDEGRVSPDCSMQSGLSCSVDEPNHIVILGWKPANTESQPSTLFNLIKAMPCIFLKTFEVQLNNAPHFISINTLRLLTGDILGYCGLHFLFILSYLEFLQVSFNLLLQFSSKHEQNVVRHVI